MYFGIDRQHAIERLVLASIGNEAEAAETDDQVGGSGTTLAESADGGLGVTLALDQALGFCETRSDPKSFSECLGHTRRASHSTARYRTARGVHNAAYGFARFPLQRRRRA
jgi:hypothetical protein